MTSVPRVAFLPDTFHEVNGVALTSRQLDAFARRRQIPFLSVHCGPNHEKQTDGSVTTIQLQRGRAKFGLDSNLDCDPLLLRYAGEVTEEAKKFGAELVHITGPGDVGILGCEVARRLKVPLVLSWHTSLHEYAGRRLERMLSFAPETFRDRMGHLAEEKSWGLLGWFYRKARVVLAPNQELVQQMRELTGRPTFLMQRGVDTTLFNPAKRSRTTPTFRIGYVGRLTPEKNVRFLAELGQSLKLTSKRGFEFVIIGEGSEKDWLQENVPNATLTGVLRGEALAQAYASMDLFVFPSTTDTFGNVVLEAMASGVPAVVTAEGGPKFLVQSGVTGYVAADFRGFIKCVNGLLNDLDTHHRMREAARHYACGLSWDSVFEKVFKAYAYCLQNPKPSDAKPASVKDPAALKTA